MLATGRLAPGDIPQAGFEFLKDAQHVPPQRIQHAHRGTGKPMDFLERQPALFEPAEHHPAALCAKIASDVVLRVHDPGHSIIETI